MVPIGRTAIRMIDRVSMLTSGSMARSEREEVRMFRLGSECTGSGGERKVSERGMMCLETSFGLFSTLN